MTAKCQRHWYCHVLRFSDSLHPLSNPWAVSYLVEPFPFSRWLLTINWMTKSRANFATCLPCTLSFDFSLCHPSCFFLIIYSSCFEGYKSHRISVCEAHIDRRQIAMKTINWQFRASTLLASGNWGCSPLHPSDLGHLSLLRSHVLSGDRLRKTSSTWVGKHLTQALGAI